MDSLFVWLFAAIFVLLGLLVRKYPKLIAGYNTMSPERQKLVDVKGLTAFMCRAFCIIGLLIILVYYLLLWGGMAEMAAVLVSVIAVPVVGSHSASIYISSKFSVTRRKCSSSPNPIMPSISPMPNISPTGWPVCRSRPVLACTSSMVASPRPMR